jgi:hypothetical protein
MISDGGVFQGDERLTDNASSDKQRHHDGEYNFCNSLCVATLPVNRFSAAADFQDRIPADVSSPMRQTQTSSRT